MRFVVFLLGVLGSLLLGFFGWLWLDYTNNRVLSEFVQDYDVNPGVVMPDYITDFPNTARAGVFLAVGAFLGLFGSLLALVRSGRQAALLMVLAAVGPVLFHPATLMFTAPLAFVGILSLFIRRAPPPAEEPA